ncbi:hypothetical protein Tco_1002539 [Tanacetum coccineum]|uniref:Uncharacterized protein n=1 Tax=Tanacetum coccineum TaxID=301880 RepID=A0ABQ5F6N3_9ASTR
METTIPQKEDTFQVVIDLVKNSSCFKAFTIFVDVLEIFMQQFWYFIKKVQGTDSYEFLLANKKCVVNADVCWTIFDICLRVEGVNFTDVPDDDTTLVFLIKLGYKGPLYKHTNMFVDHMHQPWRTRAAIINKENVDYSEVIWEDLAYQIDHRKEKRSRHKNMSFPRFTKIRPKKRRGKGSQRKKTADDSQETVDVSEESEPEPEPNASRRMVKKNVTISAANNIIPDPDVALELGKSIRITEAEEEAATKQVHATHARIVNEYVLKSAKKNTSKSSKSKLKGVLTLTPEEQEATYIMQALKESKETHKRQPSTEGSSEGTGVLDEEKDRTEEKVILELGDEQDKEYSDDVDNDDIEKDDKDGDADDEGDDHISDTQDADDEDVETESDEDEIYK